MRTWIYGFHHRSNNSWLEKQKAMVIITRDERLKLLSFMAEMETDSLGVSCKFFTISYRTFGSVRREKLKKNLIINLVKVLEND